MKIHCVVSYTNEEGKSFMEVTPCATRERACEKMKALYKEWVNFYGKKNVDADIEITDDYAEAHVYSNDTDNSIDIEIHSEGLVE